MINKCVLLVCSFVFLFISNGKAQSNFKLRAIGWKNAAHCESSDIICKFSDSVGVESMLVVLGKEELFKDDSNWSLRGFLITKDQRFLKLNNSAGVILFWKDPKDPKTMSHSFGETGSITLKSTDGENYSFTLYNHEKEKVCKGSFKVKYKPFDYPDYQSFPINFNERKYYGWD